jgi:NAD(P)-dependent dehydrogenase (short-subunit alcohol dehydrogenase family)
VEDGGRTDALERQEPRGDARGAAGGDPRGRLAEPEDVANLAVFLPSELAGYVSGAIIAMDGGRASVI